MLTVSLKACSIGSTMPLATAKVSGSPAHLLLPSLPGAACPPSAMPFMPIGTRLRDGAGNAILTVTGHALLPPRSGVHALACPLVTACTDLPVGEIDLTPAKEGVSLAWVTLSDKGSMGLREDESGPIIENMVRAELEVGYAQGYLLPDDGTRLRALLTRLALDEGYDLVITTGGTGVGPRDVTPQATARVLDMELPGFSQAMTMASLKKTPRGVISRALCGAIGQTLVINLPGSRKAVAENLEAVLPALGHTIDKLRGDPGDCGA